jgi:hypothetical protein
MTDLAAFSDLLAEYFELEAGQLEAKRPRFPSTDRDGGRRTTHRLS